MSGSDEIDESSWVIVQRMTRYTRCPSPLGELLLVGRPGVLAGLYVAGHRGCAAIGPSWIDDADAFADARGQLDEYFAGSRTTFELDLDLVGTAFQVRVWRALLDIPFGVTTSYGELASRIGKPTAARAVGAANGKNPISVIVPCHRVIGATGTLVGYGWGTERKSWLLEHERAQLSLSSG